MSSKSILGAIAMLSLSIAGCDSSGGAGIFTIPQQRVLTSELITAGELPDTIDPTRSYVRPDRLTSEEAEAAIMELLDAGIAVDRGWLPLDGLCGQPVGPRFTVLLATADERMEQFDFAVGEGQLDCASELIQYVVTVAR